MAVCVSLPRTASLALIVVVRASDAAALDEGDAHRSTGGGGGAADSTAGAAVKGAGEVPSDDATRAAGGAPSPFVRVVAGVGGVGLHPLGGHVDRLGVSAGGFFVEGLAGVPFGSIVVGGAIDGFFALRERVRFPDESVRRADRSLQALTAGPVLLWYPWGGPAGFHAGVSPRGFWVPGQAALGEVARLPAQFGAGVQVQAGHDWALDATSALGAEARLGWGTTFRDDTGVSAYQFLQLTLGASVTFR